jgi:small subunit ribosomal protein S1
MTMADLLAKQESKNLKLERGQEIEGEIILVTDSDVILDLGNKAEGVLSRKEFPPEKQADLKPGDKVKAFIVRSENESGQVVLELYKTVATKGRGSNVRLDKFIAAQKSNQVLKGRGMEVNKGGLVVEIDKVRGFLPSSLVSLSQAANLEDLVDKDIQVTVVEVDPGQNRLILSQKTNVTDETKEKLSKLKIGDKIEGEVAAVLSFGIFVNLPEKLEGLVHVSELAWEKVEDPATLYKVGDKVEAQIVSVDTNTGRANLSVKQLLGDPFKEKAEKFQPDDIVKGVITKVTGQGIFLDIDGVEGFIPSNKLEADESYEIGKTLSCLVDSVDIQRRKINLAPFITSTKDLIYK